MRRIALLLIALTLVVVAPAGARPGASSWAQPQIKTVVRAGLLAPTVASFRPQDPLTAGELAAALEALGARAPVVTDPERIVTIRELDAQLVIAAGLRLEARSIRSAAVRAGLRPTAWLGTETVARLLGFRINHSVPNEHLELQVSEPASRAEAAYSLARLLALRDGDREAVRAAVATLELPELTDLQRRVLAPALRLVGSPYVYAGTSERPQQLLGKTVPGGFDCSGLVWRVYKLDPGTASVPGLASTIRGRTSYAMSAETPRSARVARAALQPADVVFFGPRGPRSKPAQVGHVGIYVGGGWMVHSSSAGTTLQPLTGWYETTFAWGRRPLAEAGLVAERGTTPR